MNPSIRLAKKNITVRRVLQTLDRIILIFNLGYFSTIINPVGNTEDFCSNLGVQMTEPIQYGSLGFLLVHYMFIWLQKT